MMELLITFDLDGVLQVNPFRRGVFPEVCTKLGETLVKEKGVELGEASKEIRAMIVEESRRRLRRGEWVEAYDWDNIVNTVAQEVGSPARFDVAALVEKYCTRDYIASYPHAKEVLDELSAAGFHLAVVTNGFYQYQHPVMEALGLRGFFPWFITPHAAGTVKPDPAIFRKAAQLAGACCEVKLHVGDTLIHDVYGAREAGFDPVWVLPKLPTGLDGLTPSERAVSPELGPVICQAFQDDFCPEAYPHIRWEECTPAYVIRNLSELPGVVAEAQEKAA